jgi:hypothetical protein
LERGHCRELASQPAADAATGFADAETGDDTVERLDLALLDFVEDRGGVRFTESADLSVGGGAERKVRPLLEGQVVQVGWGGGETGFDEGFTNGLTDTFDVESVTGAEVFDPTDG